MKAPRKQNTAHTLSVVAAALAVTASAGGLLLPGLYRDNAFYTTAWLGNDIITLAVAVPVLVAALYFAQKGSQRAKLLWMGAMTYLLYNYAFYLFGAAFNRFFPLYVALFALSLYALVSGISNIRIRDISGHFSKTTPVRWVSLYLFCISIPLAIVEGGQYVRFVFSGTMPEIPHLIMVLDLSVVVPNSALAGILLWHRRNWGFLLSALMLVKASLYGMVLMTSTALIAMKGLGPRDPLMPFYTFVTVGGLISLTVFLKNISNNKSREQIN